MIKYDRLFDLLEKNGYTTYRLRKENIIGQRTLYALKHGTGGLDHRSINKLCNLLNCSSVDEIMEFVPDPPENE